MLKYKLNKDEAMITGEVMLNKMKITKYKTHVLITIIIILGISTAISTNKYYSIRNEVPRMINFELEMIHEQVKRMRYDLSAITKDNKITMTERFTLARIEQQNRELLDIFGSVSLLNHKEYNDRYFLLIDSYKQTDQALKKSPQYVTIDDVIRFNMALNEFSNRIFDVEIMGE
ncbi:hypothetical protein [Bacillus sp. FJAT-28004]|uniref:hypothetical protein n=1 Tax=Bacillus sp. FJAT-28004 TaxID=1679165 RepID=UPI0006B59738|nr:hypothetical protein [Bacillus sp. FJAT-28004]